MKEKNQNQKSVYVDAPLWQKAKEQAGSASLSFVISRLLEMWLNGDVKITVEPMQEKG